MGVIDPHYSIKGVLVGFVVVGLIAYIVGAIDQSFPGFADKFFSFIPMCLGVLWLFGLGCLIIALICYFIFKIYEKIKDWFF